TCRRGRPRPPTPTSTASSDRAGVVRTDHAWRGGELAGLCDAGAPRRPVASRGQRQTSGGIVTVTTAIDIAGLDGGTVRVPAAQIGDLAARVRGALLTADADGWDDAVSVWNAMTANRPALVVQPQSAS